jgi:hypothetical protein
MTLYVQFSDSTETEIVSVFCGPQDPEHHSNLGEVEEGDQRYLDFKVKVEII